MVADICAIDGGGAGIGEWEEDAAGAGGEEAGRGEEVGVWECSEFVLLHI